MRRCVLAYQLISADSHIVEPPNLYTTRIESRFRERAPRMERLTPAPLPTAVWINEPPRDGHVSRRDRACQLLVMSSELSGQYERQERWRHWDEALTCIPLKAGQRILDLGCGVGQIAARFDRLGAQVIGVDGNEELLKVARTRYPEVRFEKLDLRELTSASFGQVDGYGRVSSPPIYQI